MFYSLEDEGILDISNEVDMFCLHLVFLNRINSALKSFVESWNMQLSSMHACMQSHTPNQLFILGALDQNTVSVIPSPSHSAQDLPQPASLAIPTCSFSPCRASKHEVRSIAMIQSCDDLGYHNYI